ncbi:MAG: hypothetical protein IH944_12420 [Armatimonadetes bacterium]|nr:hypothetical protein [Armatimonadota bacterium]
MKKIASLLLCAALSAGALGADKDVEDLLAKMRKAYQETKTASFELETTLLAVEGDVVIKMKGLFKSPNKLAVDIVMNIASDERKINVISDGKQIYASATGVEEVGKTDFSIDRLNQALGAANLEVLCFYDWKRQLSTDKGANMHDSTLSIRKEKWKGKEWIVLEESAPRVDIYVEYFIDPKTHFIWKTIRMTLDKEFTNGEYVLTKLKTGLTISDKRFAPPIKTAPPA